MGITGFQTKKKTSFGVFFYEQENERKLTMNIIGAIEYILLGMSCGLLSRQFQKLDRAKKHHAKAIVRRTFQTESGNLRYEVTLRHGEKLLSVPYSNLTPQIPYGSRVDISYCVNKVGKKYKIQIGKIKPMSSEYEALARVFAVCAGVIFLLALLILFN